MLATLWMLAGCTVATRPPLPDPAPGQWRGVHLGTPGHEGVPMLLRLIREGLPPLGINQLIIEVNYGFQYASHPELADPGGLSVDDARAIRAACDEVGIRLIPMFQCLGHQSWAEHTHKLLATYPQFDESPAIPMDNPGIYCRSWCPQHPEVNPIVFDLMDELIDAFGSTHFHVGLDEVFIIAHESCERCRGKDPADLFAQAVNDYHRHLVGERGQVMMMWGDRLLDAAAMGYGEWESATNGTHRAIDRVPRDIIQCDWHYELRDRYPSVRFFQDQGFAVWPCGWRTTAATLALIDDSLREAGPRMLGHLFTTWSGARDLARVLLREPGWQEIGGNTIGVAAAMTNGARRLGADVPEWPVTLADEIRAQLDVRPILAELERAPAGRVVRQIAPTELLADATIDPGWRVEGILGDEPRAVGLLYPRSTPSRDGSGVSLAFRLAIPADARRPALTFVADDSLRTDEWTGFRFWELRAGERVLWSDDAAGDRSARRRQTVSLADVARPGETLELTLRLVDRRGVHDYQTAAILLGVALIEAPPGA